MPKVKDIGLGKHLSDWEKERKEKEAKIKREERYKRISKRVKPIMKKLHKIGRKSQGKGVTLSSIFGKRK